MRLTNMIIRDVSLLTLDRKILALSCICFLRKIIGIENLWFALLHN